VTADRTTSGRPASSAGRLCALESATAGEAGKASPSSPSEVKSLANQTAKADRGVAAQVRGDPGLDPDSVTAIAGIGETIRRVSRDRTTIASAVESRMPRRRRSPARSTGGRRHAGGLGQLSLMSPSGERDWQAAEQVLSAARERCAADGSAARRGSNGSSPTSRPPEGSRPGDRSRSFGRERRNCRSHRITLNSWRRPADEAGRRTFSGGVGSPHRR